VALAKVTAAAYDPVSAAEARLVQESFGWFAADPGEAMEYLYARLFVAQPEFRALFPLAMDRTRALVYRMLAGLITTLDSPATTAQSLARLAADHRKFGVKDKHYQPFFDALLATAEHMAGPRWTAECEAAWRAMLGWFEGVMSAAAARDAADQPAWWIGEVVKHDRRGPTIAVVTVRPDAPLRYQPGQYLPVQVPRWPRIWRHYSMANSPRESGLIDLHVRAVPGGMVSNVLVGHCAAGDTVVLGAPRGAMIADLRADRHLVCVAGGTGLAPLKALVQAVVAAHTAGPLRPAITLYVGGRSGSDLYDLQDLEKLALGYPPLAVIPVAQDRHAGGLVGVVAAHPSFKDTDVYISGPVGLVEATVAALRLRVPPSRLHHDPVELLRDAAANAATAYNNELSDNYPLLSPPPR